MDEDGSGFTTARRRASTCSLSTLTPFDATQPGNPGWQQTSAAPSLANLLFC